MSTLWAFWQYFKTEALWAFWQYFETETLGHFWQYFKTGIMGIFGHISKWRHYVHYGPYGHYGNSRAFFAIFQRGGRQGFQKIVDSTTFPCVHLHFYKKKKT